MKKLLSSILPFVACILCLNAQTTEIQYLSGYGDNPAVEWEFMCSDGNNSGKWTTIKVPSCWELQGFGTYQYGQSIGRGAAGVASETGLYKYKFRLPEAWNGKIIKLVFDGVMTDCSVTLNGRPAVKLHQGAFYRFEADVTDRIFMGKKENLLEVSVSKESANPSVNAAERRGDYWNFGGIFRPVFVKAMPAQHIDRLAVDAQADGSFKAEIFLGFAVNNNAKIRVSFSGADGKNIGIAEYPVPNGSDKTLITHKLSNVKQWTAETPNLYSATFSLLVDGKIQHSVNERFGFRTIEVRAGDGLYINGQKMLVRGVNRHSFRPETGRTLTKKDNYDDVLLMKEMNLNAVRLSHYPPDPEFLDACDELGLYVMDELGGWHGMYDSNVGVKLVKEMVIRDLNHPSIIWWSNGNEGGHNFDLDGEFPKYDLQKRPVLHPQKNFGGFETMHYRSYGESLEYMRKPEIWMPTEILHGLYDGGHGAGLWDYWEICRRHSRSAGAFLWVLADEGVVRTDQNGRIDNVGNYGADGIVGPHHEREGSFYTAKQIWSPVQISAVQSSKFKAQNTDIQAITEKEALKNKFLNADFDVTFEIENRYDFTNTKDCKFVWTLKSFAEGKEKIIKTENIKSPDIAPHSSGIVKLNLPADWKKADALYFAAFDKNGAELWTWDFALSQDTRHKTQDTRTLQIEETDSRLIVSAGKTSLVFGKADGSLREVKNSEKTVSLSGIKFIAARRGDRSQDVYYNHDDKEARSKERIYFDISNEAKNYDGKTNLTQTADLHYDKFQDSIVVTTDYKGKALNKTVWTIKSNGEIRLDYEYEWNGTAELLGVYFDYPENQMLSKTWLGQGAYRVWQNRLHGTKLGIWTVDYNDPIPGETFTYPEFKGYFADWRWATFNTAEGKFTLKNGDENSYLGVYAPRDGRDAQLYTLPETGIAILKVIPAVRNKVNSTDLNGPSAAAQWVYGLHKGSVWLEF